VPTQFIATLIQSIDRGSVGVTDWLNWRINARPSCQILKRLQDAVPVFRLVLTSADGIDCRVDTTLPKRRSAWLNKFLTCLLGRQFLNRHSVVTRSNVERLTSSRFEVSARLLRAVGPGNRPATALFSTYETDTDRHMGAERR